MTKTTVIGIINGDFLIKQNIVSWCQPFWFPANNLKKSLLNQLFAKFERKHRKFWFANASSIWFVSGYAKNLQRS